MSVYREILSGNWKTEPSRITRQWRKSQGIVLNIVSPLRNIRLNWNYIISNLLERWCACVYVHTHTHTHKIRYTPAYACTLSVTQATRTHILTHTPLCLTMRVQNIRNYYPVWCSLTHTGARTHTHMHTHTHTHITRKSSHIAQFVLNRQQGGHKVFKTYQHE